MGKEKMLGKNLWSTGSRGFGGQFTSPFKRGIDMGKHVFSSDKVKQP